MQFIVYMLIYNILKEYLAITFLKNYSATIVKNSKIKL